MHKCAIALSRTLHQLVTVHLKTGTNRSQGHVVLAESIVKVGDKTEMPYFFILALTPMHGVLLVTFAAQTVQCAGGIRFEALIHNT